MGARTGPSLVASGREESRDYPHYLKSSVYCGECGSRLIVHHAMNRHGTTYEYFVCAGRHSKRTSCSRQAMRISMIEEEVAKLYRRIALTPEAAERVRSVVREDARVSLAETLAVRARCAAELKALSEQARKLLDGHLSGVIPSELYAEEQERISARSAALSERIASSDVQTVDVEANVESAICLAEHCHEAYTRASDSVRRQFNEAFFSRLYIDERGVADGELAEPFQTAVDRQSRVGSEPSLEENEPLSDFLSVKGSHELDLVPPVGLEPTTQRF